MKLAGMIALTFVLIASLLTGCGCTATDTTGSTSTTATTTTQAPTTAPTTAASTAPTTAATVPSTTDASVPGTDGHLPDGDPVPDSTNGSGRRGIMGPRGPMPMG